MLSAAAAPGITVIGDSMLDRYWFGSVRRISPEAPVPVLLREREVNQPGGAGNVACSLVALGCRTSLLTCIGRDAAGHELQALLAAQGVRVAAYHGDMATTLKIRLVTQRHQIGRADIDSEPDAALVAELTEHAVALIKGSTLCVLSDYGRGTLGRCEAMLEAALQAGCRVLVDPKHRDAARYRGAWLVKPNEVELRDWVGPWDSDAELATSAQQLRQQMRWEYLLVTLGERGMVLVHRDGCTAYPTEAREVFDVTGAGDAVIATLAASLAHGYEISEAVGFANRAAGIVVGRFGAGPVSREDLGWAALS